MCVIRKPGMHCAVFICLSILMFMSMMEWTELQNKMS